MKPSLLQISISTLTFFGRLFFYRFPYVTVILLQVMILLPGKVPTQY